MELLLLSCPYDLEGLDVSLQLALEVRRLVWMHNATRSHSIKLCFDLTKLRLCDLTVSRRAEVLHQSADAELMLAIAEAAAGILADALSGRLVLGHGKRGVSGAQALLGGVSVRVQRGCG